MADNLRLFIYNVFFLTPLYIVLRLGGLFNSKIKRGIAGRIDLSSKIKAEIDLLDKSKPLIWFHSASLGEFEQAKPIIEKLKHEHNCSIIVTFFSPSGLENSLKYPHADIKTYIPFDFKSNVKWFLDLVNPTVSVMMRYDIWPNFIFEIKKRNIPLFLVDATMREDSSRANILLRGFHKILFSKFDKILTVTEQDLENFKIFDYPQTQLLSVGDSKFDRVYERSLVAKERKLLLPEVVKDKKVLVAGSIHHDDADILIPVLQKLYKHHPDLLTILVPHEPRISFLEELEQSLVGIEKSIRFSFMNNYMGEKIIIVDSIGVLLLLYYYSNMAFIGGSYSGNVHNALEAAVYGIPVIYGPKIHNTPDVITLTKLGGGIVAKTKRDLYKTIARFLHKPADADSVGAISKDFICRNVGATNKIVNEIVGSIKK